MHREGITAMTLIKISNDCAGMVIALLVFVVWHSLCYRSDAMRARLKSTFGGFFPNGIMRGGFIPVPAAMSVGLLLFVTTNFVGEEYVRGPFMVPSGGAFETWTPGKRCRWTSTERSDWLTYWGARWERRTSVNKIHDHASR